MSTPLITPELVSLDANLGSTKTEVITSVAGLIAAAAVSYTHLTLPTICSV